MRAGWVLCGFLFCAPALHALEVYVGSSFKIINIQRTQGTVRLPAERKKYHNIRILNRATYLFLLTCTEPCRQQFPAVEVTAVQVRPDQSRPQQWWAQVEVNGAWQFTFQATQQAGQLQVRPPADLILLEDPWQQVIALQIARALAQENP